jgi:hypothetical protein
MTDIPPSDAEHKSSTTGRVVDENVGLAHQPQAILTQAMPQWDMPRMRGILLLSPGGHEMMRQLPPQQSIKPGSDIGLASALKNVEEPFSPRGTSAALDSSSMPPHRSTQLP